MALLGSLAAGYINYYSVRGVGIALALVALTGCSSVRHTDQGLSVLRVPGNAQVNYVKKHKSLSRLCTETNVDASVTSSGGLTLSALGDAIGDTKSTGDVTMGGRDPTVLIARELMYRSCELALNLNLGTDDAIKIYMGTLDVLIEIVKVHTGDGTSSMSATAAQTVAVQTKTAKTAATLAASSVSGASSDSTKQGSGDAQTDVNSAFSSFWSDYTYNPNSIDTSHP